jgi:hypothetical protein
MGMAVADIYLAYRRVRLDIRMGNFDRLSDYLNSAPGAYLSGTSQLISNLEDTSPGAWEPISRDMVAQFSDIRFLDPIHEEDGTEKRPEVIRERIPVTVELEVDAWRIIGMIHLMDRVPWSDFLHSARRRFIPLSGAVALLAGSQSRVESDLLLINGARINALYAERS